MKKNKKNVMLITTWIIFAVFIIWLVFTYNQNNQNLVDEWIPTDEELANLSEEEKIELGLNVENPDTFLEDISSWRRSRRSRWRSYSRWYSSSSSKKVTSNQYSRICYSRSYNATSLNTIKNWPMRSLKLQLLLSSKSAVYYDNLLKKYKSKSVSAVDRCKKLKDKYNRNLWSIISVIKGKWMSSDAVSKYTKRWNELASVKTYINWSNEVKELDKQILASAVPEPLDEPSDNSVAKNVPDESETRTESYKQAFMAAETASFTSRVERVVTCEHFYKKWNIGDTDSCYYEWKTYKLKIMPDYNWWFTENLNVWTKISSSIAQWASCTAVNKYCYNNIESNCESHWWLYQWDQVMCGLGSEPRSIMSICPNTWKVPNKVVFDDLVTNPSFNSTWWKNWNMINWLASPWPGYFKVSSSYNIKQFKEKELLWWTSTELNNKRANVIKITEAGRNIVRTNIDRTSGLSVVCQKQVNELEDKSCASFNKEWGEGEEDSCEYWWKTYTIKKMPDWKWWFTQFLDIWEMVSAHLDGYSNFSDLNSNSDCNNIKKYCPDNEKENCNKYWWLYEYAQANCTSNPNDDICPNGWIVPSNEIMNNLQRAWEATWWEWNKIFWLASELPGFYLVWNWHTNFHWKDLQVRFMQSDTSAYSSRVTTLNLVLIHNSDKIWHWGLSLPSASSVVCVKK